MLWCLMLLWQCLWLLPGYCSTNLCHLTPLLQRSHITEADVAPFSALVCYINTCRPHALGEGHNTSGLQETSGMHGMSSNVDPSEARMQCWFPQSPTFALLCPKFCFQSSACSEVLKWQSEGHRATPATILDATVEHSCQWDWLSEVRSV